MSTGLSHQVDAEEGADGLAACCKAWSRAGCSWICFCQTNRHATLAAVGEVQRIWLQRALLKAQLLGMFQVRFS